ncbi:MAG: hypothetical protein CO108_23300 [Deltaproteobacteria bacterium CG_4_9_14_3_um_filter_63_12]|nr:MAG: hypothetical protein CO108_23300 [Deltaproteobacteria bacterium CG_4_9_14_3_um_filter_63_12]
MSQENAVFSEVAHHFLTEGQRRQWWARAQVEAALRARGLPVYDALLRYEALLSGLESQGAYLGLTSLMARPHSPGEHWTAEHDGALLVAYAHLWPQWYYADEAAVIYVLGQEGLRRFADSPLPLVERLALERELAKAVCVLVPTGASAPQIAAALGFEPLSGAETATARWWWADGNVLVENTDRGEVCVALYPRDIAAAVSVLETSIPGVSWCIEPVDAERVKTTQKPAASAPEAPSPSGRLVLPMRCEKTGASGLLWVPKRGKPRIDQVEIRDGKVAVEESYRDGAVQRVSYLSFADSLNGVLSPLAVAELERRKAWRELSRVGPVEELEGLLERFGLQSSEVLLKTEATFAGLRFDGNDPDPERFWLLGALWNLRSFRKAKKGGAREPLVPFMWGDCGDHYFLDPTGVVLMQDEIEMSVAVPVSSSPPCFLEQLLRRLAPKMELHLCIDGLVGSVLAAALGAVASAEASDEYERWWHGPGVTLCEPLDWRWVFDNGWEGERDEPAAIKRLVTEVWCEEAALLERARLAASE